MCLCFECSFQSFFFLHFVFNSAQSKLMCLFQRQKNSFSSLALLSALLYVSRNSHINVFCEIICRWLYFFSHFYNCLLKWRSHLTALIKSLHTTFVSCFFAHRHVRREFLGRKKKCHAQMLTGPEAVDFSTSFCAAGHRGVGVTPDG